MKRFLTPMLIVLFPVFTFSQQKNPVTPEQQLQKEMDEFRKEMEVQMKALQDSLTKLKEQLNENDPDHLKDYEWSYHFRMPEIEKEYIRPYLHNLDQYFKEHRMEIPEVPEIPQWYYRFEVPEAPEAPDIPETPEAPHWNYHYEIPEMPEMPEWKYELRIPDFDRDKEIYIHPYKWKFDLRIPEIPDQYWREQKQDHEKFLEMLPFYNLFKS